MLGLPRIPPNRYKEQTPKSKARDKVLTVRLEKFGSTDIGIISVEDREPLQSYCQNEKRYISKVVFDWAIEIFHCFGFK